MEKVFIWHILPSDTCKSQSSLRKLRPQTQAGTKAETTKKYVLLAQSLAYYSANFLNHLDPPA